MFDETNIQEEQELDLPEKLFDEDELSENVGGEAADEENCAEQTLRIKYNGEERDITLSEAKTLAQKGMNYDHVVAERDTKYLRELEALDKAASAQGMTRAQYITAIENGVVGSSEKEQQKEKASEDAATRARNMISRLYEKNGFGKEWTRLFNAYPELSRDDARKNLSEAVGQGLTPLEAYQARLIEQYGNEQKIVRNNDNRANSSVGSLESNMPGDVKDDFLEGFLIEA